MSRRVLFAAFAVSLVSAGLLRAAETETQTVGKIDRLLHRSWDEAGVKPANPADDATFLRRAHLDFTGVIPTVGEVREFLADPSPDKRVRLIDRLIGTSTKTGNSRHATHLAEVWQEAMLPQLGNNLRFRFQAGVFQRWLRDKFADNVPYDEMVRELITFTGPANSTAGPGLFYQVLEAKPEELAASTSRMFLGVQIQCAQCHNHPFDVWTQKDFWGYAAFFAQLQQPRGQVRFVAQVMDVNTGEVKLPDTETVVAPKFLGSETSAKIAGKTRRQELAKWLTAKDNPYFAKATVNRAWAMLFGRGLVDPVDDFGKHNPASHPELLNALAKDFAENGYDMRRLFRVLGKTRAYQLSSEVKDGDSSQPHLFHRMAVKSLTAGQIYECLETAICKLDPVTTVRNRSPYQIDQQKQAFVSRFEAPTQTATELQTGIPQALTMMNGSVIAAATDPRRSDILIAVSEAPFLSPEERVETLFLSALSRKPTEKERRKFADYVLSGGPTKDRHKALSNVFWALLNSTEFLLNH